MKEKILAHLKKGIADPKTGKTSVSDQTLNSYVELIAPSVTEESQIEAVAAPYIATLKEVQANINSVAAAAVKNAKPSKTEAPETPPEEKPEELEARVTGIMEKFLKPHLEKIEKMERQEQQSARQNMISKIVKELDIPEWRSKEGFAIGDDMDEAAIRTYLSGVKTNIVTNKLEGEGSFALSTPEAKAKEDAKTWAATLPDAQ